MDYSPSLQARRELLLQFRRPHFLFLSQQTVSKPCWNANEDKSIQCVQQESHIPPFEDERLFCDRAMNGFFFLFRRSFQL